MDLRDSVALSCLSHSVRRRAQAALRDENDRASALTLEGVIDAAARPRATASALRASADSALARAARAGLNPIALGGGEYPPALAAIFDPPPVLWVAGQPGVLPQPAVAVVGSRAGSPYALEVAEQLGADLASRGIVVVSGLARGVDSAAHRGALAVGGITVAVLGSGTDVIYPPEHRGLAAEIVRDGAVVSELPPGTPPRAGQFPLRNRIISGLSLAVVVVEASDKSGSLITASCALEQGREVMVVPGNILTGRNRGSHSLLRDGAKIVESADDILEELGLSRRGHPGPPATGGPDADPVLTSMADGETYDLDQLAGHAGLPAAALLSHLLMLELRGSVRRTDGGRFARARLKW